MSQSETRAERCETCRFWQTWGECPSLVEPENWFPGGECRRHAPGRYTVKRFETLDKDISALRSVEVLFPPIGADGWCGEWQPIPLPVVGHDLLSRKASSAEISIRAKKAVCRAMNNHKTEFASLTLGDIVRFSANELLAQGNFGESTLSALRAALANHGLKLKGD